MGHIYNYDEMDETKEIEGIPVAEETKYLGVKIINKDIFRDQRKNIMKKAQRMANVSNGAISKSCNKVIIGKKLFGKNLAIPGILYAANIMTQLILKSQSYKSLKIECTRRSWGLLLSVSASRGPLT